MRSYQPYKTMKTYAKFISRMLIPAVAGSFALIAASSQAQVDEHANADNPHLRRTPTSGTSAGAEAPKLSQKDQKFLSKIAVGGVQAVRDSEVAEKEGG